MDPTEESKLLTKILSLEIGDESDKAFTTSQRHAQSSKERAPTNNVKHEADKSVVTSKGNEIRVHKDNVLEIINDGFAVEEVVGHNEEIPDGIV